MGVAFGPTLGVGTTDLVTAALTGQSAARSWTFWVNPRSLASGTPRLVDKRNAGTANTNESIRYLGGASPQISFFRGWSVTNATWTATTGIATTLNTWQQVVITYDSSSVANVPALYVNGVSQAFPAALTPLGTAGVNTDAVTFGNNAAQSAVFDGILDGVGIVNRIVTAAEIANLASGMHPCLLGGIVCCLQTDGSPIVDYASPSSPPTLVGTKFLAGPSQIWVVVPTSYPDAVAGSSSAPRPAGGDEPPRQPQAPVAPTRAPVSYPDRANAPPNLAAPHRFASTSPSPTPEQTAPLADASYPSVAPQARTRLGTWQLPILEGTVPLDWAPRYPNHVNRAQLRAASTPFFFMPPAPERTAPLASVVQDARAPRGPALFDVAATAPLLDQACPAPSFPTGVDSRPRDRGQAGADLIQYASVTAPTPALATYPDTARVPTALPVGDRVLVAVVAPAQVTLAAASYPDLAPTPRKLITEATLSPAPEPPAPAVSSDTAGFVVGRHRTAGSLGFVAPTPAPERTAPLADASYPSGVPQAVWSRGRLDPAATVAAQPERTLPSSGSWSDPPRLGASTARASWSSSALTDAGLLFVSVDFARPRAAARGATQEGAALPPSPPTSPALLFLPLGSDAPHPLRSLVAVLHEVNYGPFQVPAPAPPPPTAVPTGRRRYVTTVSSPDRYVWLFNSPKRYAWNLATLLDGMANFTIRQGDTGRPLVVVLKNQDGSDVAVPGGATVTFKMVQRQTGHVVAGSATFANGPNTANNNQATYPFSNPADTSRPGVYDAVWVVVYPGGATETFPTDSHGVSGYKVEVVPAL